MSWQTGPAGIQDAQDIHMKRFKTSKFASLAALVLAMPFHDVAASEMVYTPINPSFGGNPNNGPNLQSIANAQNGYTAPKPAPLTPLQRFNNALQQSILNTLASEIRNTIFGTNGNTITPGTYDTVNYTVTVIQNADGSLTIQTTDKTTGATASFDISTAL